MLLFKNLAINYFIQFTVEAEDVSRKAVKVSILYRVFARESEKKTVVTRKQELRTKGVLN